MEQHAWGFRRAHARDACALGIVALLLGSTLEAEDWPTYMHDNARSGITREALALPLSLHWRITPPAPHVRAWPGPQEGYGERRRLVFDDAFATVVVGETVYFGSSVDNKIHAVELATGRPRWSFTTGGAVRLAPTVHDGKVYAGADDGYAWCLAADTGAFIWKVRCGPDSSRMLGHGRMVSPWPVRTGIVVEDRKAFFGGGVFSLNKVYIHSVDATTGEAVWEFVSDFRHPTFSAQGHALLAGNRLVIPAGRNTPFAFDAATGALAYATVGNKIIGGPGSYALLTDGKLVSGTQGNLSAYDLASGELERNVPAMKLLIDRDLMLTLSPNSLRRLNRSYFDELAQLEALPRNTGALRVIFRERAAALLAESLLWKIDLPGMESLILAGDTVFAGGKDELLAIAAKDGGILWREKVEGTVASLTAANGVLLAGTEDGDILCFAAGQKPAPLAPAPKRDVFPPGYRERAGTLAQAILAQVESDEGYCLLAGNRLAALAAELATRSKMQVHYLAPSNTAATARRQLEDSGFMANRVAVMSAENGGIPLPSYFANLVVVEGGEDVAPFMRLLKAHGGMLFTIAPGEGEPMLVTRRGAVPGAANWTHQYADAGNTGASTDTALSVPLSMLWYGAPGSDTQQERHLRGPAPLVVDGRVFVQCETIVNARKPEKSIQYILCFDSYNGIEYWRREIPGASRRYLKWYESNLAAGHDSVFVASGNRCFRLDGRTGELLATYGTPPLPGIDTARWSYVAVSDAVLVGSVTTRDGEPLHNPQRGDIPDMTENLFSDALFAYELETGNLLWVHRGTNIKKNATCISGGKVFLVDEGEMDDARARTVWETFLDSSQRTLRSGKPIQMRHMVDLPDPGDWEMQEGDEDSEEKGDLVLDEPPEPEREPVVDRFGNPVPQVEPSSTFKVSALDLRTGEPVWSHMMDLTYCGGDALVSMVSDGILLFSGNYTEIGHENGIRHGEGFFANRRLVAVNAEDGSLRWSKRASPNLRPLITDGMIISSPYAFDLKTGEQRMVPASSPSKARGRPWTFTLGGCGIISGCPAAVFGRRGCSSYVDLSSENGQLTQLPGTRPGCWINMIPAGGLLVETEASSGCTCLYPAQATVVYYSSATNPQ